MVFFKNIAKKLDILLLTFVLTPTAITAAYLLFYASEIYVSESSFIVRSADKNSTIALGSLLKGSAFSVSKDESYSIQNYIQSRSATADLVNKLKIDEVYSSEKIDTFSRFGGMYGDLSLEALHKYLQEKISISIDPTSAIGTLKVKAFDPEQARKINEKLLRDAEGMVNRLSQRSRKDFIEFAMQELGISVESMKRAEGNLYAYRKKNGILDPERKIAANSLLQAKLREELLQTQVMLDQLMAVSPISPQLDALRVRVNSIRKLIAEKEREIGIDVEKDFADSRSYKNLLIEYEVASKQLASAINALDSARNEAARKSTYVEIISEPSTPDKSSEPKVIKSIAAVFVFGLLLYFTIRLMIAGVREHAEQ